MVRRFCDECSAEITEDQPNRAKQRIKRRDGRVIVEVLAGVDNTWNGGDLCTACVIHAVLHGAEMGQ